MKRQGRIIRRIWAACLILAGMNHARILFQHGLFWDYYGANPASAIYWSSLTVVDPLAAALLFVRPTIGVPATVTIITTNVIHNLAVTARYVPNDAFWEYVASNPQIMSQIGFLLLVIATCRMAWGGVRRADALSPSQPG